MLTLRKYQQEDVDKLKQHTRVALLNQQRTGKTPTSLRLSKAWGEGKTLIVCTGSMLYKWQQEFITWTGDPCEVLTGTPKQRQASLDNWTHGLVVTYDTLKKINHYHAEDKDKKKKEKRITHTTGELERIKTLKPDKLIVDEFHRAKNSTSARAKALYSLCSVNKCRVALTGTPSYSTQLDIYGLLQFLFPEKFKSFWNFRQEYVKHKKVYTRDKTIDVPVRLNSLGTKLVHELLQKYATQRKTTDPEVMNWLPEKPIPEHIYLPCSKAQDKALKELAKFFETENEEVIAKNGLDRITKYRQIISEPKILMDIKEYSPKTNWVLNYMKEYTDTPTIYFTNSTKHVKILLPLMNKIAKTSCIIGSTTLKERAELEKQFQEGSIKHLICNTQCVQEGLTLDTGEVEVMIEQFPPYGSVEQALERFTATIPEKKDIPKKIIKLIMRGTYDEAVKKLIETRKTEVDIINDFKKYIKK